MLRRLAILACLACLLAACAGGYGGKRDAAGALKQRVEKGSDFSK